MYCRLNLLLVFMFALPGVFCANFAYGNIRDSLYPPYSLKEDGNKICDTSGVCHNSPTYIVWTVSGYHSYPKEIIDGNYLQTSNFLESEYARMKREFKLNVEMAKDNAASSLKLGIFLSIIAFGYFAIAAYYWSINKIELQGNILFIHSFWVIRSRISNSSLMQNRTYGQTSRNKQVPIDKINKVQILTLTPLIPDRTDISQINWRDRALIYYTSVTGVEDLAIVDLFSFPGFKKIIRHVLKTYPQIAVYFTKRTCWENLKEGGGSAPQA